MAVAFDANATIDVTANAVTAITTSNLTISAGSNLALIAQIIWSGAITMPVLQWDKLGTPVGLTAITNATVTQTVMAQLFGLVAPVSGAKQLSASWTTARDVYLNQLSYTGVDQTGGATSFPGGASASATTGTNATVTITSAVGDAVVAACGSPVQAIDVINNTTTFTDVNALNMNGAGNRAAGAASVAMTYTIHASATWAVMGSSIKAAAAAGAVFTKNRFIRQAVNRAGTY